MGGRKEAVHDWSWMHGQATLLGDPSISRGPYSGLGCTGSWVCGFQLWGHRMSGGGETVKDAL